MRVLRHLISACAKSALELEELTKREQKASPVKNSYGLQ